MMRALASRPPLRQRGLTLVEIMVSMVLMLLVAIATVALYNVSSSSYRTVDANLELQDSARFAMEVIGQAARSAGYQDRTGPATGSEQLADEVFGPTNPPDTWRIEGRNGAVLAGADTASSSYSNSGVVNSSDAMMIRFFGANMPDPANPAFAKKDASLKPVPDGSMIDCSGRAVPYPSSSADVGVSAFFVKTLNGEPELYCMSWDGAAFRETQVVRGVETLQIVYGVDTNNDEVADKWLGADVISDDAAVTPNWNHVVAMRVGMVLRGPAGSGQGQSANAADNALYPLGKAFTCENTASSCTPSEAAHKFALPDDGRLRRAFATTFLFRSGIR
jgi:type IV pilus assembly protein PilW